MPNTNAPTPPQKEPIVSGFDETGVEETEQQYPDQSGVMHSLTTKNRALIERQLDEKRGEAGF